MVARSVLALGGLVACAVTSVAEAGPFSLTGDNRWIAFASRQSVDEAVGVARAYRWDFPKVRVMQSTNGWYAVVAGPERVSNPRTYKENLLKNGGVPSDLIFSKGDAYLTEVWKPEVATTLGEVKFEGKRPVTLQVGDLNVTVTAVPDKSGSDYNPLARGYQGGKLVFSMRLDENSVSEPQAHVTAIRLDPSSQSPQIVFTSFWGGAHCCTMTKIATLANGGWRVMPGKTLDGGGYGFEDIDQDGAYELVSADNGFLYTYTSYAESHAPIQVSKVVGDRIVEVTKDPSFHSYNRQQLHLEEHRASLDSDLWKSNGFLAAWVATKALVGEFDDGWSRMLPLYDRSTDWPLTECSVDRVRGQCPEGKERSVTFPVALRKHLQEAGYISPNTPSQPSGTVAVARPAPVPSAPPKAESRASSGTGFFVTSEGHVVTNSHVVGGCSTIDVKQANGTTVLARVLAQDSTNDLALLKVGHQPSQVASLRIGIRLGEPVAAFGFPLSSVLASSGNFTLGNVTALAGIGDDTRHLQISAPVQPGNSGGPLLDETGSVVGVVTSKLNALRTVAATGDVPQNVNFAIKTSVLATFLESNRIEVSLGTKAAKLSSPDLADQANSISVLVRCQ
jgi:S1-C subfamily serine protease